VSDPLDGDPDELLNTDPDEILEPDDDSQVRARARRGKAPEVSAPEVPTPGEDVTSGDAPIADYSDVHPELRRRFWRLVFVIKFSLLSVTIGVLFAVFEGRTILGGQLAAFGVALIVYGLYQYRAVKTGLAEGRFETEDDEEDNTDEGSEDNIDEEADAGEKDDADKRDDTNSADERDDTTENETTEATDESSEESTGEERK